MSKALVLAATDFKQRSGINSAASLYLDGHSVDLSEELVEQKPSIVRSDQWDTWCAPKSKASATALRVCWQCPEMKNPINSNRRR